MILALIGPHGVGKSTLGAGLARATGLPFDPELGRALAEDPTFRPAGQAASAPATAFDQELFTRELARDLARGPTPRVVETWHPGNLAYAAERSPAVAAAWLAAVRAQLGQTPVLVQPLIAAPATLRARQSEPGDPEFYRAVGQAAGAWAAALGLRIAPVLSTDQLDPDALVAAVAARFDHFRHHPAPCGPSPWSLPCAWS
jgi:hypothetical protein